MNESKNIAILLQIHNKFVLFIVLNSNLLLHMQIFFDSLFLSAAFLETQKLCCFASIFFSFLFFYLNIAYNLHVLLHIIVYG